MVDVEMETTPMPVGFWSDERLSEQVLLKLHDRLRRGGWGVENVETLYSYFEHSLEPLDLPQIAEELALPLIPARKRWGPPEAEVGGRFWVYLTADYLKEHPRLLEDLPRLRKEGVIDDWHISFRGGPWQGESMGPGQIGHDYFIVIKEVA